MGVLRYVSGIVVGTLAVASVDPFWGCGMLGPIPGISPDGSTTAETQKLIDGLKGTSSYNKVSYWNYNFAPDAGERLSKDFVFMPENWGVEAPNATFVRTAGAVGFTDLTGEWCPATMADIFLGANEPDIKGSCMGAMMGSCTGACTLAEVNASDCPVCHLNKSQGSESANENHHCNCYIDSHATGSGFWPVPGVSDQQPLPTCWDNAECVTAVMTAWKQTAATAVAKGYKYLSAPLVAANMDWMKSFVKAACTDCSEMDCGCPTHVAWHFYANDCQPEKGGYDQFQAKLDATIALMSEYPSLKGAIINEAGMLNCDMSTADAICIPNGKTQKYPARSQPNHACPSTPSLPNGLASFIQHLMGMVSKANTADGRRAVVGFTWFSENMNGGTYNLGLFDDNGSLNEAGQAYISSCQAWAAASPSPIFL